jgi:hypothetical protein
VLALAVLVTGLAQSWRLFAQGQAPQPAKGIKYAQISPTEMQEWLTYLASDTLLGRQVFTEGYGLAAGYVSVTPLRLDRTDEAFSETLTKTLK